MLASGLGVLVDLWLPVELEVVVAALHRSADDEARSPVGEDADAAAAASPGVRRTSLSLSLALSVVVLRDEGGTGPALAQELLYSSLFDMLYCSTIQYYFTLYVK